MSTTGHCKLCQRSGDVAISTFIPILFNQSLPLCLFHPQALNKKEHRGCDSPDGDSSYVLTPNTEEKYKKINEEFDNMMKSHKIVSCIVVCFSSVTPYVHPVCWYRSKPVTYLLFPPTFSRRDLNQKVSVSVSVCLRNIVFFFFGIFRTGSEIDCFW